MKSVYSLFSVSLFLSQKFLVLILCIYNFTMICLDMFFCHSLCSTFQSLSSRLKWFFFSVMDFFSLLFLWFSFLLSYLHPLIFLVLSFWESYLKKVKLLVFSCVSCIGSYVLTFLLDFSSF